MRLDLYQTETALIAQEQTGLLDEARLTLCAGRSLSRLEQNGVLHSIQVLVENAIGKAKQLLKAAEKQVPLSAYDCFLGLAELGVNESPRRKRTGYLQLIVDSYIAPRGGEFTLNTD